VDLSARKAIYIQADTKTGKHGVSSGFGCEQWDRRTGYELKKGSVVDSGAREGILVYIQSESRPWSEC